MRMNEILLVEDNAQLNEGNRRALEGEGYTVLAALTLAEAREHLAAHTPGIILLDVMLPDGDGINFCGEIRGSTDAHILFLTSKTEHTGRIRGLDTGGDDYITKPYKLEEMLSRVKAAMRRRGMEAAKPPVQTITFGPLMLDTVSGRAYFRETDLLLKPKEQAILRLLMENRGGTASGDALYQAVWNQPMIGDGKALWTADLAAKKEAGGDQRRQGDNTYIARGGISSQYVIIGLREVCGANLAFWQGSRFLQLFLV
jgi:DNA-binding response OmpR family regulator